LPEIRPFRGLRYAVPDADLARVLAPPYDVIPDALRDALYARDPRNIVRVILNREPGDRGYAASQQAYAQLIRDGVLREDPADALYVIEQAFPHEGRTLRRFGLLARFRAEDPAKRVVLPHEKTRAAAKEDRWRVLNATRANFSPIFMMMPDASGHFSAAMLDVLVATPTAHYVDDAGIGHRLWSVSDRDVIARFVELIGAAPAYIADGHHRYATALRYRDTNGPDGAFSLGYFTPIEAPGLQVLPYHRILSAGPTPAEAAAALGEAFSLGATDLVGAQKRVAASSAPYAFALAWATGEALVVEAKESARALLPAGDPPSLRALDTYLLHRGVLPRLGVSDEAVAFVHSLAEAEQAVSAGHCELAILLRGTPVRQILDVADAGESMPAKSTFFHPKLPSGFVIHPLLGQGVCQEEIR
jgi:uncharacterized protein (DUF1015 family)